MVIDSGIKAALPKHCRVYSEVVVVVFAGPWF